MAKAKKYLAAFLATVMTVSLIVIPDILGFRRRRTTTAF